MMTIQGLATARAPGGWAVAARRSPCCAASRRGRLGTGTVVKPMLLHMLV